MEHQWNGSVDQSVDKFQFTDRKVQQKEKEREEISRAVDNFLNKGGVIKVQKTIDDNASRILLEDDTVVFL